MGIFLSITSRGNGLPLLHRHLPVFIRRDCNPYYLICATLSRHIMQLKFRLDPLVTSPTSPLVLENSTSFSLNSFHSFRIAPAPPSVSYGSFEYDSAQTKYNKRWNSRQEFLDWLELENLSKGIELRRVGEKTGKDKYVSHFLYVCSRHGTGGVKSYTLKNPHWIRKIASKQSNCQCFLKVKTYHHTPVVLAIYTDAHNQVMLISLTLASPILQENG